MMMSRNGRSASRSLHWERGLKHFTASNFFVGLCRSLHWERGLKHPPCFPIRQWGCRSLHWERGLKPQNEIAYPACIVAPFIGSVD